MHPDTNTKYGGAMETPSPMPPDDILREQMEKARSEAQERCAFHEAELSRWRTVYHASSVALDVLTNQPQQRVDLDQSVSY